VGTGQVGYRDQLEKWYEVFTKIQTFARRFKKLINLFGRLVCFHIEFCSGKQRLHLVFDIWSPKL
jgi:hypothetical protein